MIFRKTDDGKNQYRLRGQSEWCPSHVKFRIECLQFVIAKIRFNEAQLRFINTGPLNNYTFVKVQQRYSHAKTLVARQVPTLQVCFIFIFDIPSIGLVSTRYKHTLSSDNLTPSVCTIMSSLRIAELNLMHKKISNKVSILIL